MITPEAFAAERAERLKAADGVLESVVRRGLDAYGVGDEGWPDDIVDAVAQIWLENFQAEAPGANYRNALARFRERTREVLGLTGQPDGDAGNAQVDRVVHWLSTYAVNDGTVSGAAARGIRYKRWVTMEDAHVRGAHRMIDGEVRPIGGTFDVAGTKLAYPGEPKGPLEAWLNCRCVLMPASREGETMSANTFTMPQGFAVQDELVNPDGTPYTGALVVLVPAENDPVVAASSEPAHLTFVWFGEMAHLPVDADELEQAVRLYAQDLDGPVTVPVRERGTLGNDDADVAFLEPTDSLLALRDGLLANEPVKQAHDAAEQFPEWTPHVTLGYPERPAQAEYDADSVTFDRISLWLGGEHFDYPMGGTVTAAATIETDEVDEDLPIGDDAMPEDDVDEIPVHGVLAPEGIETGDGRGFREGALSTRPLPIPLRYEIVGSHGGNQTSEVVTVGRVDEAWRDDATGMWRFRGVVISSKPYADAAIQGMVDGSGTGTSIDADAMALDMSSLSDDVVEQAMADGKEPTKWFASARVAGLTIVPIPAFPEAYVGLGPDFMEDLSDEDLQAAMSTLAACGCDGSVVDLSGDEDENYRAAAEAEDGAYRDIPGATRKKMADAGTAMPDGSYPIANEEDLRNAIQSIGRAKNPDAVKAHIKKRAKALGKEALIPEGWSALTDFFSDVASGTVKRGGMQFAPGTHDGPGWITHPRATQRIRNYWVRGKGAAKIKWGVPGDFNRCRRQLAKYVQNPEWLAGLCANMHKEAIKLWPGQEAGGRGRHSLIASGGIPAPMMTLVASADIAKVYPDEWFEDPKFTQVTPMHIDPETGRVWGHLAQWGVCHLGIAGTCVQPQHSATGYAYYLRGVVDTDKGERRVANLTAGIGHADPRLRAAAATAHYDDIDAAWAYVNIGEDRFGIWYSGVITPWTSEETVAQVRGIGSVSGDWRRIGAGLELVAAVSVNTPGYPILSLAASGGLQDTMILSGVQADASQTGNVEADPDDEANEEFFARAVVRALGMIEEKKHADAVRDRALTLRRDTARARLNGVI